MSSPELGEQSGRLGATPSLRACCTTLRAATPRPSCCTSVLLQSPKRHCGRSFLMSAHHSTTLPNCTERGAISRTLSRSIREALSSKKKCVGGRACCGRRLAQQHRVVCSCHDPPVSCPTERGRFPPRPDGREDGCQRDAISSASDDRMPAGRVEKWQNAACTPRTVSGAPTEPSANRVV